ncbi:MAG: adenosine kinase [Acidimicrobiales bacterium]
MGDGFETAGTDGAFRGAPVGREVVGIGSALVDVVIQVNDEELASTGLAKGSMTPVDLTTAERIHSAAGSGVETSGGSAANTMAGFASLGGHACFVGVVGHDRLGRVFTEDIRACGVHFEPSGHVADVSLGTGRCLVLVTPDAERTMATHLGAANGLRSDDVPLDLVASAKVLYLEGYLWDLASSIQAMRAAIAAAHSADGAVALSLSDPFCVDRHRVEFLQLVRDDLDVLFGNEEELVALFGSRSFDAALTAAEETGLLVAATRGEKGSVVIGPQGPVTVDPHRASRVVDTTGAGDLYAAGFLFGLVRGAGPSRCAELGGLCAAEVIGHLGARPSRDLLGLAQHEALL